MEPLVLQDIKRSPAKFESHTIVVVGDIAFDRTFRCKSSPEGAHARHGAEEIFDIEPQPDGDDFGAVGSSNNTALFCRSFGVRAYLFTAIGPDDEGNRVRQLLSKDDECLTLTSMQTVTRMRFFVYNSSADSYVMKYRMDKDPAADLCYAEASRLITEPGVIQRLRERLESCDGVLLNDTEKGFLSPKVVDTIGQIIRHANEHRTQGGCRPIIVVVDPKKDWGKFVGFPLDVLKPNAPEASGAASLSAAKDSPSTEAIRKVAERLFEKYGAAFPRIVITLGRNGAAILEGRNGLGQVTHYPGFRRSEEGSPFHVATHCGDMFASALLLALVGGYTLGDAVNFANLVGSVQFTKMTGTRVGRDDLLCIRPEDAPVDQPVAIADVCDEKEKLVQAILDEVGAEINLDRGLLRVNNRKSKFVAGPAFQRILLSRLVPELKSGRLIFLSGETRTGKGEFVRHLNVVFDAFVYETDVLPARNVLDKSGELDRLLSDVRQRGAPCLVLDEIQSATSTEELWSRYQKVGETNEPFCLILAGHFTAQLDDLRQRAGSGYFEFPPYRDSARRGDIPYLVAEWLLRKSPGTRKIRLHAMRELLRCDYHVETLGGAKNYAALEAVLKASTRDCDETLTWEKLDLSPVEGTKGARPAIEDREISIRGLT